jgi:osmoprotectant transport system ATP-binding protein
MANMGVNAVEFREVSKDYGTGKVLENFNLEIPREKIVTIIGPSGCGKTTLLKMINRLIEPESGTVLLEGEDISTLNPVELRRNIGYVIQQIGLFPHMTIEQNISIVPRLKGEKKEQLIARAEELLELIGLDPAQFRKRYPHELSGGQQQRIGVARALAANPSIILMDEPFSALDPISRVQLQKELIKLNAQVKKTIVFVTHDIDEALKIADEVILLKDGIVIQKGAPQHLLEHPAHAFVQEFIGVERFPPAYSI